MDKICHRVIKYLQKKFSPKEIHVDMFNTLGDKNGAPSVGQSLAVEYRMRKDSLEAKLNS